MKELHLRKKLNGGIIMDSEWYSVCCGAPPDDRFQFDTFLTDEPLGICSECQEHTHFKHEDDEDE